MRSILIFILLLALLSCKKDNKPPNCHILIPEDHSVFEMGDSIRVLVESSDPDGLIHEIHLYFDGRGIASLKDFPYVYDLRTTDYGPGNYAIKALAFDQEGLSGSDEIEVTINAVPAKLTTSEVSSITDTSALTGGIITADGGAEITGRGVCWSTVPGPTLADPHTEDGRGIGAFISLITGLEPNKTYYVRAYARNSMGTTYGNELSFTSLIPGDYAIDYDGNRYEIAEIGEQVWMTENLRVTHYPDGTEIPNISDAGAWALLSASDEAMSYYDNSLEIAETYGAVYTWSAAVKGTSGCNGEDCSSASGALCNEPVQGVCPDGWHIPTHYEWIVLLRQVEALNDDFPCDESSFGYFGGDAGGHLKFAGTGFWDDPNFGATNSSGFSALPGGKRDGDGSFSEMGRMALFWSSTVHGGSNALGYNLYFDHSLVQIASDPSRTGRSVRCVKD